MKKIISIVCIFSALSLFSSESHSSHASGKVDFVLPHIGNQVFFNIVGVSKDTLNNQGTNGQCISTNTGVFRIDLTQPLNGPSNETGPALYAALLAAQAQDRQVFVNGSNTCTAERENVNWIRVN